MDDSSLTRMAIEEIVREMHQAKERELLPPMERKVNPLGKPNKRFLGRTINSMLMHNKRENDRKHANCRRKLKELDEKARRRVRNDYFSTENKKYKQKEQSSGSECIQVSSSSSSDNSERFRKRKKKKKRKHERNRSRKESRSRRKSRSRGKSRSRRESRSSSRSCDKGDGSGSQVTQRLENANIALGYSAAHFYDQANIHQYTSMAAAAYNQISLIYSTMLRTATVGYATEMTTPAPERRKSSSVSSDLSITLSDESMVSASGSLSSVEADEDGILTINVSDASDGEETKKSNNQEPAKYKASIDSDVEVVLSSDNESEIKYDRKEEPLLISVDSDSNDSSEVNSNCSVVLVTCPTDSDDDLVEKVSAEQIHRHCVADATQLQIDLTEE